MKSVKQQVVDFVFDSPFFPTQKEVENKFKKSSKSALKGYRLYGIDLRKKYAQWFIKWQENADSFYCEIIEDAKDDAVIKWFVIWAVAWAVLSIIISYFI